MIHLYCRRARKPEEVPRKAAKTQRREERTEELNHRGTEARRREGREVQTVIKPEVLVLYADLPDLFFSVFSSLCLCGSILLFTLTLGSALWRQRQEIRRRAEATHRRGTREDCPCASTRPFEIDHGQRHPRQASHDRRTRGHAERVRVFTDLLAQELKLSKEDRYKLRWAALLHDIGKLKVSPDILNKPGKLDDREWEAIKRHPADGARIASPLVQWLGPWARAITDHHERYDGRGYPNGLAGGSISLGGRIVSVADAYDTMTAARSYKRSMSVRAAREELAKCAGQQFDPAVVRAFFAISLPRLVWRTGPLSYLAQSPFLSPVQEVGRQIAAMTGQGVAAATVAIGVTAATVATPTPAVATAPLPHRPPAAVRPVAGSPSVAPTVGRDPSPGPSGRKSRRGQRNRRNGDGGHGGTSGGHPSPAPPGSGGGSGGSGGSGSGSGSGGSGSGGSGSGGSGSGGSPPPPSPSPAPSPSPSPSPSGQPGPLPSVSLPPLPTPSLPLPSVSLSVGLGG